MKHYKGPRLPGILNPLFLLLIILGTLSADNNSHKRSLKVVNINIWSGLDYKGIIKMGEFESGERMQKRYNLLIEQLKELDADVITMQEVNPLPRRAAQFAKDLNMDVIYHVSEAGIQAGCIGIPVNLRQGDAIFSKKELNLEWVGRKRLTGGLAGNFFAFHFDDGAQALAGKIHFEGEPIHIFTTHWHASVPNLKRYRDSAEDLGSKLGYSVEEIEEAKQTLIIEAEWRFTEAQGTVAYIQEVCGDSLPFILTGDFNATTEMEELHILDSLKIIDSFNEFHTATEGFTWDAERNSNVLMQYPEDAELNMNSLYNILDYNFNRESYRIDYIYYHPGNSQLHAVASSVVINTQQKGIFPSDHYGVQTEFKLK
ncbi:MAG: hypothetical protein QF472_02250 [Candidatus Marinimicrobia bacterium]|nr:hypothetical protein [Candidatus Neomarinimicrobiota bacterium]